jgi:hypothetical protein
MKPSFPVRPRNPQLGGSDGLDPSKRTSLHPIATSKQPKFYKHWILKTCDPGLESSKAKLLESNYVVPDLDHLGDLPLAVVGDCVNVVGVGGRVRSYRREIVDATVANKSERWEAEPATSGQSLGTHEDGSQCTWPRTRPSCHQ